MKRALFLFFLFATAPVLAQPATPAKIAVSVTPLEVKPTELSEFLKIYSWRFKIQAPEAAPQTLLSRRLELRAPNQAPVVLTSNGTEIGADKSMELLLMMMPEGESLTTAPQLRITDKIENLDADGKKRGGDSSNGFRDNPLKRLDIVGYAPNYNPQISDDGSLPLINFYLSGNTEEKPLKSQLVLVITATNSDNR